MTLTFLLTIELNGVRWIGGGGHIQVSNKFRNTRDYFRKRDYFVTQICEKEGREVCDEFQIDTSNRRMQERPEEKKRLKAQCNDEV